MKISQFKRLEDKINSQNFNQGYKNINIVMLVLSYFGNIASIFLAYFLLSKILLGVVPDSPAFVFMVSIILLSGLELLKRDFFNKFSSQYLKAKSFTKDVMPLFLLSAAIIGISFYASISGAKEFSSKSAIIEKNKIEVVSNFKDSITAVYVSKVKEVELEIKADKTKIEAKDKEQTDIEALQPLTRQQRSRIKDLKDERTTLRNDVTKLESDINVINKELSDKIKQKETELTTEADTKKESNSSNSLMFVIISSLIEIIILAGVYFNQYYRFRSYREFRNVIEKDPNYQKWIVYDKILSVIYTEDCRINQKLPPNKAIIDMCKVNDLIILPRDITDFLKVTAGLNIIKTSGSARYINKQRDLAFESLRKHFNIE